MTIFIGLLLFIFLGEGKPDYPFDNVIFSQNFDSDFLELSHPDEFLPGWSANEVRLSNSRVFKAVGLGRNESAALAAQPISTFDAEIMVQLPISGLKESEVRFWARSLRNGSGDRPAEVFISWGTDYSTDFTLRSRLGEVNEFRNEDQEYREFHLEIPEDFKEEEFLFLKFEIEYGEGSGSCARWFIDDFKFGEFEDDTSSPVVRQILGYDESELLISYSESIDPIFGEFLINYRLNDVEPVEAKLDNDSLVVLTFSEPLKNGETYSLQVLQVPDLSGNFLSDTTLSFTFFDPTAIPHKGLVINEIMPAPKADLDLPNVEYVELYHAGEYDFRLENLIWKSSRTETILPEYWLKPGEYLLLIRESDKEEMVDYGNVLGLDDWPSLLNSGEELTLSDDRENVIDELSYNSGSWKDSDLANSGVSLEVINPFLLCDQSESLIPSVDPLRGTPGIQNSVFDISPDIEAPELILWRFESAKILSLLFSESLANDVSLESFEFSGGFLIDSVLLQGTGIQINFLEDYPENQLEMLRLIGLRDCSGNVFDETLEIEILRPSLALKGDVILNELLFNPRTGDPKFVELYNKRDKYLEIGSWSLASLDEFGEIDQARRLSENSLVIPPLGFLAVSTDTIKLKSRYTLSARGNFHQINRLPSYPISGGEVVLIDTSNDPVEVFSYNEDIHHPLLRDSKGVSLERIDPNSQVDRDGVWQSASGMEEFATPGRKNSQIFLNEFDEEVISIDPEVFDPEGSNGQTFTSISYRLKDPGWFGSFSIYDLAGRQIQVLTQNQLLGSQGIFTWTGTDAQGKKSKVGYYILLVELYHPDGRTQLIKKTIVIAQSM